MKKRQFGVSLIESIATLGIMSAVAVGTVMMSSQYTEDSRTASAAEHLNLATGLAAQWRARVVM